MQLRDDLFQWSHSVTHSLPCFYSPSLNVLSKLFLLLSNLYYVSPVAFNLSGRYLPGILVCECKIDVLLKKMTINSLMYIKSQFKEKHLNPQKVHICHKWSSLTFNDEHIFFSKKQNIIHFMSNGWPTFDNHRVQQFFKRYQIKVSNILSFHIWPMCFPNGCLDVFFFIFLFLFWWTL